MHAQQRSPCRNFSAWPKRHTGGPGASRELRRFRKQRSKVGEKERCASGQPFPGYHDS